MISKGVFLGAEQDHMEAGFPEWAAKTTSSLVIHTVMQGMASKRNVSVISHVANTVPPSKFLSCKGFPDLSDSLIAQYSQSITPKH